MVTPASCLAWQVAEIKGRLSTLERSLHINVLREFELLGEEAPSPLLLDRLKSCCLVVEALGYQVRDMVLQPCKGCDDASVASCIEGRCYIALLLDQLVILGGQTLLGLLWKAVLCFCTVVVTAWLLELSKCLWV